MGMAIFGWAVMFLVTLYLWFSSINMARFSLGFTGRVSAEVYFFLVVAIIMSGLCWWLFPIDVSMSLKASIK